MGLLSLDMLSFFQVHMEAFNITHTGDAELSSSPTRVILIGHLL